MSGLKPVSYVLSYRGAVIVPCQLRGMRLRSLLAYLKAASPILQAGKASSSLGPVCFCKGLVITPRSASPGLIEALGLTRGGLGLKWDGGNAA